MYTIPQQCNFSFGVLTVFSMFVKKNIYLRCMSHTYINDMKIKNKCKCVRIGEKINKKYVTSVKENRITKLILNNIYMFIYLNKTLNYILKILK